MASDGTAMICNIFASGALSLPRAGAADRANGGEAAFRASGFAGAVLGK